MTTNGAGSGGDVLPRALSERYRLDSVLGKGGMGIVYGAFDLLENRRIAVKLIRPDTTTADAALERFIREAKNTAKIRHPNIVDVFDLGRTKTGEVYFVMEWISGEPLNTLIKREGAMSAPRAIALTQQVCAALAAAHDAKIIHRDIKPANVMVQKQKDGSERVKVLDFGISFVSDGETRLTGTGLLVGTVEYMSPEQILGEELDGRSDLYSIGTMLYMMLTGTALFGSTAPATLIYHHVNTRPEPVRVRRPDLPIPEALERVVATALEKQRDHRYADCRAFSDALGAATAREPTVEMPHQQNAFALPAEDDLVSRPCAVCGTDSGRYAARCHVCDADLKTPDQINFHRRAEASVQAATSQPVPTMNVEPLPLAPTHAPRANRSALQGFLEALPENTLQRVAFYAFVGAVVFRFFNIISSAAMLFLLFICVASVGLLLFSRHE